MSAYFTRLAARLGRPTGVPAEYDVSRLPPPAAGRHDLDAAPATGRGRHGQPLGRGARRAAARARGAGLADHGDAALAVRRRPGVPQRDDRRALVADPGRGRASTCSASTDHRPGSSIPTSRRACSPRRRRSASAEEHRLDLSEARARYGDRIADELLLLRMMLPAEQVDAMLGARSPVDAAGEAPGRGLDRGSRRAHLARGRASRRRASALRVRR